MKELSENVWSVDLSASNLDDFYEKMDKINCTVANIKKVWERINITCDNILWTLDNLWELNRKNYWEIKETIKEISKILDLKRDN